MKHLAAVVYTSVASRPLSARELDSILVDARSFNQRVQVTGALLHQQGAFFQYFEGPPAAVAEVYLRIKLSSKHKNITELLYQSIDIRQFKAWHMAFAEAPSSVLEELTNEYWEMSLPELRIRQTLSPGLSLLLKFWGDAMHIAPLAEDERSDNPHDP